MRGFLDEGGFTAFTTTFEDLHGLKQLPGLACQRLMADGYGFGAEGDWKTAGLVRAMKVMSAGLRGGVSFMEDYTYHLVKGQERVLGAHMLEVCPSIAARQTVAGDPSARHRRQDRSLPAGLRRGARSGGRRHDGRHGRADADDRQRARRGQSRSPAAEAAHVARAVWIPRPDLKTSAEAWILAGGAHHTSFSLALTLRAHEGLRRDGGHRVHSHRQGTQIPALENELRWNDAAYRLRGLTFTSDCSSQADLSTRPNRSTTSGD